MKKKNYYIAPLCDVVAVAAASHLMSISGITGSTDQDDIPTIGDGGDNDEDAPDPTAKGMNLWDGWE
jgi:hypothetical protein